MATVLGIVILATPFALAIALIALIEHRGARRRADIVRQIRLTDALHARLGALVAPVVRRRQRRWQVTIAVPVEQPRVVSRVVETVDAVFGRERYEVVLSRQTPAPPARARGRVAVGGESLSWT
jgi:hypothetical protein